MDLVTLVLIVINLLLWPALGYLAIKNPRPAPREARPVEPESGWKQIRF